MFPNAHTVWNGRFPVFMSFHIGYAFGDIKGRKKYPKKRGHIYQSYNNNKETVKKLAIKEFKNC